MTTLKELKNNIDESKSPFEDGRSYIITTCGQKSHDIEANMGPDHPTYTVKRPDVAGHVPSIKTKSELTRMLNALKRIHGEDNIKVHADD